MFRIIARKSPLAVAQAEVVAAALARARPDLKTEIVGVPTRGDEILDRPLADIGGKELFVKALQAELRAGRAQCAVHSLKDMRAAPSSFILAAVGFAEDPRDALISRDNLPLRELPDGARIGTSSPRRTALLRAKFPRLHPVPVRGNVQTRLAKMRDGECDALLLAVAGLRRLNLAELITEILPPDKFIPAVGQGLLAVECAAQEAAAVVAVLDDPAARTRALAERAFAAKFGGDCHTPMGAHATIKNGRLYLSAFFAAGKSILRAESEGPADRPAECGAATAETIFARFLPDEKQVGVKNPR